jgi:hypothetical protein
MALGLFELAGRRPGLAPGAELLQRRVDALVRPTPAIVRAGVDEPVARRRAGSEPFQDSGLDQLGEVVRGL